MTRYLCLDAAFDSRHSVLAKQEGCTQTVETVAGGYSFKKTCGGQTTTGTAIGDFHTAYKITEQRGPARVQTAARWAGAAPRDASPATCRCPTAPWSIWIKTLSLGPHPAPRDCRPSMSCCQAPTGLARQGVQRGFVSGCYLVLRRRSFVKQHLWKFPEQANELDAALLRRAVEAQDGRGHVEVP